MGRQLLQKMLAFSSAPALIADGALFSTDVPALNAQALARPGETTVPNQDRDRDGLGYVARAGQLPTSMSSKMLSFSLLLLS